MIFFIEMTHEPYTSSFRENDLALSEHLLLLIQLQTERENIEEEKNGIAKIIRKLQKKNK